MEVSQELILNALWETLYMVSISLFLEASLEYS